MLQLHFVIGLSLIVINLKFSHWRICNITNFPIGAIFIHLYITQSINLELLFKAVGSPRVLWIRSNSSGSLIYCLLFANQ